MAVTVQKVMDIEAFSDGVNLVAGHAGVTNVITYITVSETPDFYEWVSGGEFVLTTLYAFKDNKELQIANYTELAKRGIAAFGVKVQRFVDKIPQELIDIANTYQIPLFAIRRKTKFREIIQIVTAELNNYQTNILLEVDAHYKELAKAALVSGNFTEYIQGFGRRKGSSIYCFRADLKLVGSYQKSSLGNAAAQEIKEKLKQYILWQGEVLNPVDYSGLHIFPCVARGQALGYLVIVDSDRLSEKHMLMASQLTTFLTMKLTDQLETEQKMLLSLLDELLYKRNLSEQELRGRLALHGLKHQSQYRVIIVQEKVQTDLSLPSTQVRTYCNKIKELLNDAIIISKTNEIVIIGSSDQADGANAPHWLKELNGDLANESPIIVGIGPSVGNAKDIQSSYQIAKSTIKAGSVFDHGSVLYYSRYLALILLLRSVGTPEEKYLLDNIINPLVEQDKRYNTQILPTIEATMFADDLEHAATALYVHTNTIRYRLNKIKSITGHDFFTASGRYMITTAYLVYRYNR